MISKNDIHSILVTRLRFMGDVILTLPSVRALRKAFPDATIRYLSEKPFDSLLENHPDIDGVLSLDTKKMMDSIRLLNNLIRERFDLAIDLFGNPRSAWFTLTSGAKIRIGGDFRGRRIAYTHRIPKSQEPQNAIRFHLSYLRPIGIPAQYSEPQIYLTDTETMKGRQYLNKIGITGKHPLIAMHPGASWPAKRWLPERFSQLADLLVEQAGADVLLTSGPGEEGLIEQIMKGCRNPVYHTGVLPIRNLGAVLSRCDAFVSNDCGPMHLAPAVGTNTIGLFGPGEPEIWFPYDPKKGHRFIHREIACSRCHLDFCSRMNCMKAISVEDVFSAIQSSLAC